VLEAIGTMLDFMLPPMDGSDSEAGKVILRQMASATNAHYTQFQKGSEAEGKSDTPSSL
jgi:hypothetical protein